MSQHKTCRRLLRKVHCESTDFKAHAGVLRRCHEELYGHRSPAAQLVHERINRTAPIPRCLLAKQGQRGIPG